VTASDSFLCLLLNPVESTRADLLLREALTATLGFQPSRSRVKALLETALVFANGRLLKNPSASLPPGEIRLEIRETPVALREFFAPAEAPPAASSFSLPILFEDEQVLILNKRSGVPSVPQSREEGDTAVGFALRHAPAIKDVGRGGLEPGILHRLDTGTSGVLAFAKTRNTYEFLLQAWRTRAVRKIYRALARRTSADSTSPLEGFPRLPHALSWPLAHDRKSAKKMRVLSGEAPLSSQELQKIRGEPLPAKTHLLAASLVRTGSPVLDLEIEIETGVMHQIRAHLSHLGYPLQGDAVYGGVPSRRLWLHAHRLILPDWEGTERARTFEAPLPEGWPVREERS
jgi:23S rRNA pseudouridine1911/1915/1917 synthase